MDSIIQTPGNAKHTVPNPQAIVTKQRPIIPTEFTLFPKFPLEIRTYVWHWSFPRGRKIRVYQIKDDDDYEPEPDELIDFKSSNPSPPTFSTNRESRQISLKRYNVLLHHPSDPKVKSYFHPALDTVVFPDLQPLNEGLLLKNLSPELSKTFSAIQLLELHNMWWERYPDCSDRPARRRRTTPLEQGRSTENTR
jgi:hypothetical protein